MLFTCSFKQKAQITVICAAINFRFKLSNLLLILVNTELKVLSKHGQNI